MDGRVVGLVDARAWMSGPFASMGAVCRSWESCTPIAGRGADIVMIVGAGPQYRTAAIGN